MGHLRSQQPLGAKWKEVIPVKLVINSRTSRTGWDVETIRFSLLKGGWWQELGRLPGANQEHESEWLVPVGLDQVTCHTVRRFKTDGNISYWNLNDSFSTSGKIYESFLKLKNSHEC